MPKSRSIRESLKRAVNRLAGMAGVEIVSERRWGKSAFQDLIAIRGQRAVRTVFDVGANVGQTVGELRRFFAAAKVHSFEPYPPAFAKLQGAIARDPLAEAHNLALGKEQSTVTMYLAERDVGNSLLPLNSELPAEMQADCFTAAGSIQVPVTRIDVFCRDRAIGSIDLLKIDTQGFEQQVLEGAGEMLRPESIGAVYFEVNFEHYYQGQSRFTDLFELLSGRGFRLVDLYGKARGDRGYLHWCDCLFV